MSTTQRPAKRGGRSAPPAPDSTAAGQPPVAAGEPAPVGESEAPVESAPLNRAERRGRAKTTGQPHAHGKGKVVGARAPAAAHRMWSNRRAGS